MDDRSPQRATSRSLAVGGSVAAGVAFAAALILSACRPADGIGAGADSIAGPESASARGAPPSLRRESGLDVLLITIDTLRADALGSYRGLPAGDPRSATPWLDRLAEGGVRFAHARAHNVVTLPSHATILSGLHPHEHGVRDNSGFRFPDGIETLATILSARGYRTGAFVSAFPLDSRFGLERGFDVYDDGFADAGIRTAFLEPERPAVETVERAARWLAAVDEDAKAPPWFAWVHLYEPHYPYEPPAPFDRRIAGDAYLGEVAAADAALEPLLAPILAAGADADALLVVTSDHGEALGEHGEATHGIFAYEGTLRVPLIVFQPRLLEPRVVDAPARLVDLLPTILDLLGDPSASDPALALSGRSLAALAAGAPAPPAVATYFEALSGALNRGWAPLFGVVDGGWKYVRLPIPELYDLSADPGEEHNLAATQAERARELEATLATLLATSGDRPSATTRRTEDAETKERLEALGYVTAAGPAGAGEDRGVISSRSYSEEDDPKRLIALDAELREITGLHAAGDLAAARARCRELLARRPGMRVVLMTLAQIERDLGDLDAAIGAMRAAWELHPEDAGALAALVSYLTQADRAREAVELSAEHAAGARPDLDVLFMRSLALARLGRSAEAEATIERARELDPDNPMVAVHAGTHALMAGRRQEARSAFERALALDASAVRAHTALAVLDTEEGRIEPALDHWRRAIALEPREAGKLLGIAAGQWRAGQHVRARPLLELFVETAAPELFGAEIERVRGMLAGAGPGAASEEGRR